MNENVELWVPILGHENQYAISSLGRIKSIERIVIVTSKKGIRLRPIKERILKQVLIGEKGNDYLGVKLCVGHGRCKSYKVHNLMAMTFMYHQYLELIINSNENYLIDHRDENRFNNELSNLQIISYRENRTKAILHKNPNRLMGVKQNRDKFQSQIFANGQQNYLGTFGTGLEAHEAYLKALTEINAGTFSTKRKRKRLKSNKIIITPKIAS
jgi:hypothetical protein